MMPLEDQGADVYLGRGPQYPWGGLYGGQIVAQGLRAGAATVEERFHVHSLHAYFIRPGDADEPIRFEVTRSRDGRSFCTRHVVASQAVGVILTMSLSFQVDEAGHDVQTAEMPAVPPPEELVGTRGARCSSAASRSSANVEEGRGVAWLRMRDAVGDDRSCRPARSPTCQRRPPHRRRGRRPPRPSATRGGRASSSAGCRPASTTPSGSTARRSPTSGTSTTSPPTATCRAGASASATSSAATASTSRPSPKRSSCAGPGDRADDRRGQSTRSPYIQRSGSAMSSRRSPSGPRK